MPNRERN